jgi:hypothetical protein
MCFIIRLLNRQQNGCVNVDLGNSSKGLMHNNSCASALIIQKTILLNTIIQYGIINRLLSVLKEQSMNILIAEDEKDLRELLKLNLENEGYRVIPACNGIEALELFKATTLTSDYSI